VAGGKGGVEKRYENGKFRREKERTHSRTGISLQFSVIGTKTLTNGGGMERGRRKNAGGGEGVEKIQSAGGDYTFVGGGGESIHLFMRENSYLILL